MVDAAATSRGLLAMAFAPRGGAGLVQIVATSPLALLLELPLESVPRAIKLKGVPGNEHFLTVGFEAGPNPNPNPNPNPKPKPKPNPNPNPNANANPNPNQAGGVEVWQLQHE